MYDPPLFRERSRTAQAIGGAVVPAVIGALAGVLAGASVPAYWGVGALAGVGGFLGGFEHRDGWDAADRGFVGGAIYGSALLIARVVIGNHSKVSLGTLPVLLALVTAIIGMLLSAAGGCIARIRREHAAAARRDLDPSVRRGGSELAEP